METSKFIDAEEISIEGRKYMISLIPAVQAQELYGDIVKATDSIGDIGMTFLPSAMAVKLLTYSAFDDNGTWVTVDSEENMNRACRGVMPLIKLEAAMIRKNFGFLFDGSLRKVLEELRGSEAGI